MPPRHRIADAVGAAFLAGVWEPEFMAARGAYALRLHRPSWLLAVALEARERFPVAPADEPEELRAFVLGRLPGFDDPELAAVRLTEIAAPARAASLEVQPPRWLPLGPKMGARRWPDVCVLDTVDDLARRLELDHGQLAWLADARGLERRVRSSRLRNYRYRWLPRTGALPRLIEQPKARLKESQRILLREILDAIPVHDAVHGFARGRSVRSHAAAHVGARVVLRFDLEDFFASVGPGRVWATFRAAGYSRRVAHVLTALCTNVVPADEWASLPEPEAALIARHWRLGRRLATPHLPQGAPTSPALANLAAFGLDVRLSAYAATLGATYTRYADDLTLSGDRRLLRGAPAVRRAVIGVARDEGFRLNPAKSQLMTRAGRQTVCSVVVNERLNAPREEVDRLKAILHDAGRNGLDAANRDGVGDFRAHLAGRIAWVESLNPARGARLRDRLAAIG